MDSDSECGLVSDADEFGHRHNNGIDNVCTKAMNSDDDTECVCYTCYCGTLHERLMVEQNKDPIPVKFGTSKKRRLFFLENPVLQNSSRLKYTGNVGPQQQQQTISGANKETTKGNKTNSNRRQKMEKVKKEETLKPSNESPSIRTRRKKDTRNYGHDRSHKTDPFIFGKEASSSCSKNKDDYNVNDTRTPRVNYSMSSDSDTDMGSDDSDSDTSSCSSVKIRNDARKHVEEYNRRKRSNRELNNLNSSLSLPHTTNAAVGVFKRENETENESDSDIEIPGIESGSRNNLGAEESESDDKVVTNNKTKSQKILKEALLRTDNVLKRENESDVSDAGILRNDFESQRWRLNEESSESDVESIMTCVSDSCMEISGDEAKIPMPGTVFNYSGFLPLSTNNNGVRKTVKPSSLRRGLVNHVGNVVDSTTTTSKQKNKLTAWKPQTRFRSFTPKKKVSKK